MRRFVLVVLGLCLSLRGEARAADALAFDLSLGPCVDSSSAEIERLLRLEIDALVARAGRGLTGVNVPVTIVCLPGGALLRVHDPLSETTLERPLRVARAAPAGRARLIAIATVELLATAWTDLAREAEASVSDQGGEAIDDAVRSAAQALAAARSQSHAGTRAVRLYAFVAGTRASGGFGLAPELGARVERMGPRGMGGVLEVRAMRAMAEASLGGVTLEGGSLTPAFQVERIRGRFASWAAVGARLAYARATGRAADPERDSGETFSAVWGGPVLSLGGRLSMLSSLLVVPSVEAGWVARPLGARLDGQRSVAVEGFWLGAQMALGWAL